VAGDRFRIANLLLGAGNTARARLGPMFSRVNETHGCGVTPIGRPFIVWMKGISALDKI
jgi:hypothetical protein